MRHVRDYRVNPGEDPGAWRDLLLASRIPDRYWPANVDAIRDLKLRAEVQEKMDDAAAWLGEGCGWFVNGPLNTGKSSIAAILAMGALKRCERVQWLPVRDVPAMRFRESDVMKKADDRLRTVDLLILDDLGAERFKLTSAAGIALEEVVRTLYDRHRSIVVTSNVSWQDFTSPTGEYVLSAAPLVSVLARIVRPFETKNSHRWGDASGPSPTPAPIR